MKMNAIYLIGEIVEEAPIAPPEIDGDTTARHAWRMGYLTALQRVVDALAEKTPERKAP